MKITLIGAGNVAWHLGQAFCQAGHQIAEVWSRSPSNAQELSKILPHSHINEDLYLADSEAELFVIAVKDDAIGSVVEQLILPENALLVHTSGTKSLAELEHWVEVYSDVPLQLGVFYPLQTFSKQAAINFDEVPICVEAANTHTEEILIALAQSVSEVAYLVNSQERRMLHLAAVFACNFTNHLWALTQDMLEEADLDFSLLKPLIKETTRKALRAEHPAEVQTGPARRHDHSTIDKHKALLRNEPENYQKIYKQLTDSILGYYDESESF